VPKTPPKTPSSSPRIAPNVGPTLGSAASDYYEGVSVLYAEQCLQEALKHQTYDNLPCKVHADGTWSFPKDLSKESMEEAEKMTTDKAIAKIAQLQPGAVVPHMFCLPGMTTYRAFCDLMSLPLVGNAADVMALSTNKWQSKAIVQFLYQGDKPKMAPPFLVKPCNEDNSQGINLVREGGDVDAALKAAFEFDTEVLIERYIPLGREIRVGILEQDDGALEMLPCIEYFLSEADPIRTAAHKLVNDDKGVPKTLATGGRKCPADIDDVLKAKLKDLAVRSHKALGCRDYSLYDVRVDPAGEPYFIEACLYCSFSPKSVIVAMASSTGRTQQSIYEMLVNRAIGRKSAKAGAKLGMKMK